MPGRGARNLKTAFALGIIQELPKLLTIAIFGFYSKVIPHITQEVIINTLYYLYCYFPALIHDPHGYR